MLIEITLSILNSLRFLYNYYVQRCCISITNNYNNLSLHLYKKMVLFIILCSVLKCQGLHVRGMPHGTLIKIN